MISELKKKLFPADLAWNILNNLDKFNEKSGLIEILSKKFDLLKEHTIFGKFTGLFDEAVKFYKVHHYFPDIAYINRKFPDGKLIKVLKGEEFSMTFYHDLIKNLDYEIIIKKFNDILGRSSEIKIDACLELSKDLEKYANSQSGITSANFTSQVAVSLQLENFIKGIEEDALSTVYKTGFTNLDNALSGGIREGLTIIGAKSSSGKTTFCLQLADQLASNGYNILIFTLEQSRNELIAKSISRKTIELNNGDTELAKTDLGIVEKSRYKYYSDEEKDLINNAIATYQKTISEHIGIIEGCGDISVNEIKRNLDYYIETFNKKPIVIIDYLQILAPYNPKLMTKDNIDHSVKLLRQMSRDYKIPIILISSFNRSSYKSEASESSFKESGGIEYSADTLIGLQYTEQANKDFNEEAEAGKDVRNITLKIIKQRRGRRYITIPFKYYAPFNYFVENDEISGLTRREKIEYATSTQKSKSEYENLNLENDLDEDLGLIM